MQRHGARRVTSPARPRIVGLHIGRGTKERRVDREKAMKPSSERHEAVEKMLKGGGAPSKPFGSLQTLSPFCEVCKRAVVYSEALRLQGGVKGSRFQQQLDDALERLKRAVLWYTVHGMGCSAYMPDAMPPIDPPK